MDLKVDISNKVPQLIMTDQKRVSQVLFNLMGNAAKFTFKGYLAVNVDFVNETLIVDVTDTGIGISPEDLDKFQV